MFDFEKLQVFNKARIFHKEIRKQVHKSTRIDNVIRYQISRAALSIMLNIAEGSGRFTNPDKRKFYIIARGSLFESTALLEILFKEKTIDAAKYRKFYEMAEELSKMLFTMIRNLEKQ